MTVPSRQPLLTDKPRVNARGSAITPQRKHRKLLKDGSGSEVWPEAVEKIFVQGLREYWDSPWATYSRGRSRWRNQFLVDYLQKAGVDRTKKQVASHMQVLRNMWKGEPEFHLVAGGEELFLESGLLAPVKKESSELSPLIPIEGDDRDSTSPVSPSSPVGSLADFKFEHTTPPPPRPSNHTHYPSVVIPIELAHSTSSSSAPSSATNSSPSPCAPHSTNFLYDTHQPVPQRPSSQFDVQYHVPSYTPIALPTIPGASSPLPQVPNHDSSLMTRSDLFQVPAVTHYPSRSCSPFSRISSICLWAEGMTPYDLSIESLRSTSGRSLAPITLQLKLSLPPLDDMNCLSTLYGFHGTITFSASWAPAAKCVTKVFNNGICISEQSDTLQLVASSTPSSGENCQMTGFLPTESPLSGCRWFDAAIQTSITQEFSIDGELQAFIVHDLDRQSSCSLPAVQLTGFQDYRSLDRTTVNNRPTAPVNYASFPYSTHYGLHPHSQQLARFRRSDQTPMSCAPAPLNSRPPLMASSMLF